MTWFGAYDDSSIFGAFDRYGTLNLTVQSPVATFQEPLNLAEVADFLRIEAPEEDTAENNQLLAFIAGARNQAEILQEKDLIRKQWDLSFDYWPGYRIETKTPLVSVDLVQYKDSDGNVTALTEGVNYIVDNLKSPGIIMPPWNGTWPTFTPWPSSALLFRFTSGYACDDPFWAESGPLIKTGMKLLISHWFNNRIPFEVGAGAIAAYDYGVTSCLSYGAKVRAR